MESYLSYAGVAGSAASMLTTFYFWLVRVRNEQPCLQSFLVDKEYFLGLSRDGIRQIGLKVGVIVANYSVLPNAIVSARAWVRLRDGWQDVANLTLDKQTPQPFNLPPLQTALLRLNGTLSFPYQDALEVGSKTAANYSSEFLAEPFQMKLELRHLKGASVGVLTVPQQEGQGKQSLGSAA